MNAIALMLAITCLTASQSGTSSVAGTWTAQFDGRTYVRLDLKTDAGKISGGLSLGNLEVDSKGAVSKVSEAPAKLTPIFDVKQSGSTVRFSRIDTTETDTFELRLLDGGKRAELLLILSDADRKALAAEGVPAPKPIALTRR